MSSAKLRGYHTDFEEESVIDGFNNWWEENYSLEDYDDLTAYNDARSKYLNDHYDEMEERFMITEEDRKADYDEERAFSEYTFGYYD